MVFSVDDGCGVAHRVGGVVRDADNAIFIRNQTARRGRGKLTRIPNVCVQLMQRSRELRVQCRCRTRDDGRENKRTTTVDDTHDQFRRYRITDFIVLHADAVFQKFSRHHRSERLRQHSDRMCLPFRRKCHGVPRARIIFTVTNTMNHEIYQPIIRNNSL